MDTRLLPEDLQPDRVLKFSADAYPITQTNPVTGYRTTIMRAGVSADFLGWIQLVNGNQVAGYIYIRRPVSSPYVISSATRYVVMDMPPDLLGSLLRILQSGEPLQIRFYQVGAGPNDASAFLEHRQ